MTIRVLLAAVLATAFAPSAVAQAPGPRIGILSTSGSFAAPILRANQMPFEAVANDVPGDSLARYRVVIIDNLFRLKDLNAAAFRSFVEKGGILVILNPQSDGFTKAWSPYEVYIGEYAIEGKITDRKHPLFRGFTSDKLDHFAESNGPFVGNCSFTEPGPEWKVLARHAKKSKNALVLEATYGAGRMILACVRFDLYNARPGPTRLGDNLAAYLKALTSSPPAAPRQAR
ncbi:MAG: hypothetical protein R2882_04590 [Gemmatimonadales bacterium]